MKPSQIDEMFTALTDCLDETKDYIVTASFINNTITFNVEENKENQK